MLQKDEQQTGHVGHDDFIRCLSVSNMKVTEREIKNLVSELDKEQTGSVNYSEFLKYSYLCAMYIYHLQLE